MFSVYLIYSLKLRENTQEYILFSYDNNSSEAVIEGVLLNMSFSDLQFIIRTSTQSLSKIPTKEFIFIKATFLTPCNLVKMSFFGYFSGMPLCCCFCSF